MALLIGSTRTRTVRVLTLGKKFTSVPKSARTGLTHVHDRRASSRFLAAPQVRLFVAPIPARLLAWRRRKGD